LIYFVVEFLVLVVEKWLLHVFIYCGKTE
jgi:hypothetical protein